MQHFLDPWELSNSTLGRLEHATNVTVELAKWTQDTAFGLSFEEPLHSLSVNTKETVAPRTLVRSCSFIPPYFETHWLTPERRVRRAASSEMPSESQEESRATGSCRRDQLTRR